MDGKTVEEKRRQAKMISHRNEGNVGVIKDAGGAYDDLHPGQEDADQQRPPVGGLPLTAHVVTSCGWCVHQPSTKVTKPATTRLTGPLMMDGLVADAQTRVTKGSLRNLRRVQSDCPPDATPHLGFSSSSLSFLPWYVAQPHPAMDDAFPNGWTW